MELALCLVLLLAAGTQAAPQPGDAEKYLLPGDIVPVHYNLSLFTNIEKFVANQERTFVFSGDIDITIKAVGDNVTNIVLHIYDDVDILSANIISNEAGAPARTLTVGAYDSETNKQILIVSPPLRAGEEYDVLLSYTGRNTNDLTGFYRSSYTVGLSRRWLLVTDFESFGARRAFPCLDEPAYKATFQLTVSYNQTLADAGYAAHFNTDVQSEIVNNGRHITTFQRTPLPISTYLVAFIIADFVSSPEPTYFNSSYNGENGTKAYRTIGQTKYFTNRQDLISQVAGPAVLNFMTQKTKVGFGYNKVEQAGIPDFAAGAMENWGLVTYREEYLFWNNQTGSTGQRQQVATVTAHELGHQWFGDLVTLHWWSDLWLNEGFATYYEFHATDQIREPTLDTSSWDLIGDFVNDVLFGTALYTDSFDDSRPLTYEAYDQESVEDFFDGISYEKGGSVLRMFQHILGEDLFYSGLNLYLISQKENVGTPEILLSSWDKAIAALPAEQRPNLPGSLVDLFKGWHTQAGYPVVTVERNGGVLTLTQERFLLFGSGSEKYNVPLSYSSEKEDNFNDTRPIAFLLDSVNSTTLQLQDATAAWFVLNNQATGYFRVDYDEDNWEALIDTISTPSTQNLINEYNRIQIIEDASWLGVAMTAKSRPSSIFLRLLASLRHERSHAVWRSAIRNMRYLSNHLSSHAESSSLLKAYYLWLVEPAFAELSLKVGKEDSHTRKLLRSDVAQLACQLNLPACVEQASQLFASGSAHPDVRSVVTCTGVRLGGAEAWTQVLDEALLAEHHVRMDLLAALTCTPDEALLIKLLEMMEVDERITGMDKFDIISAAARGDAKQASFALQALSNQKLKTSKQIKQIVMHIGQALSSEEAAKKMESISESTAKVISMNWAWKVKKQPEILQWLKQLQL